MRSLPEWHSRGYIPHWEAGETPQFVTFRLADPLPRHVVERCLAGLSEQPDSHEKMVKRKRFEAALDEGFGSAFLLRQELAWLVENALLFFDGERCRIHAWCIMPNHVHVLATPLGDTSLAGLVQSWKGFTSRKINEYRGVKEPVWYREYFDRKIRSEKHFEAVRYYIEQNPVKAGLCADARAWLFSSARIGEAIS